MSYIPSNIRNQTPYTPNQGTFRHRLDANESPFPVSEELLHAFYGAMHEAEFNRYPDSTAKALCDAFANRYGIDAAHVVAGDGSDELINLILQNLVGRGERLAVLDPDFSMYRFYAELAGVRVGTFSRNNGFSVGGLADFVRKNNCNAVIFSNPCNPTGTGISRKEILWFLENCPALCIIDEAYMDFWDQSILDVAHNYENLIVLRTLSKAFGAAALRLGFAIANDEMIKALRVIKSPYNVGTLPQLFGTILLNQAENRGEFLAAQAKKLAEKLKCLLPDAVVYDTCTNFVYLEFMQAQSLFDFLCQNGIAVRIFGSKALRIAASTDAEQRVLLTAIKKWKESQR